MLRRLVGTLIVVSLGLMLIGLGLLNQSPAQTFAREDATPTPMPRRAIPQDQPERGLIYAGLQTPSDGSCPNLFRVEGSTQCTHGPDPIWPGFDMQRSVEPIGAQLNATGVVTPAPICDGDGVSGKRTQVIYARASDRADRYAQYVSSIQQWAADADKIYLNSAVKTGGVRRIRFVTDVSCNIIVANVVMTTTGDDNFGATNSELSRAGYNRSDRKYMVFVDITGVYCGIGSFDGVDTPSPQNSSNFGPDYGRTDANCWGGSVAAHEHIHNMGGVQFTAPHTSGGAHCVDEYDRMCYSDSPYYPTMQILCAGAANDLLFDCNDDDYFHTNPPGGNYLATHWNTADNEFLWRPDTSAPSGTLTSPANGALISTTVITLTATAGDELHGSGVNRVEFKAFYSNSWTVIYSDTLYPYSYVWSISNTNALTIGLAIDVVDNAGNRAVNAGGARTVTILRRTYLPLIRR